MISQQSVSSQTPMGANLAAGGATFRVWAPRATTVYLNGTFGGQAFNAQTQDRLLSKDGAGYWTGFQHGAIDGDLYRFFVVGQGSTGFKRDPYARELAKDQPFPNCSCIIRSDSSYPWHDNDYVTPDFTNMIVYQLHIGTYNVASPGVSSTFLDIIGEFHICKVLASIFQPLPVTEAEEAVGLGYDGSDYFSPDFPYVTTDPNQIARHLGTINELLNAKGLASIQIRDISSGPNQLRALVDLCHVYGIGVVFDVVYNHAGGFFRDDLSIYFWDRFTNGDNNNSLYFTNMGLAGGLSFALWNNDVRQFLIDNASFLVQSFHIDGFRYDEISELLAMNLASGWSFCTDLTSTLRFIKPRLIQNAEFWPSEVRNFPKTTADMVTSVQNGGAGFDVLQHDALRIAIRQAVSASSAGQGASVSMTAIAQALAPPFLPQAWQAVTCVENHDIVKVGTDQRLPALADSSNHRSWCARSRSRVASSLLLTAPGIPQIFMGQDVLEDKQWDVNPEPYDTVWWAGVNSGLDPSMVNHLRFMQDLIRLRWLQPALRSENLNPFHIHDENRVLAFHRWLEGSGQDVVAVATLAESTWWSYSIGFPFPGQWAEAFNSDVYDNWVNPQVAGNGGRIFADGPPLHGFQASASVVIPANGLVVFARA